LVVFGGDNFDDDDNFENIIRENSSAALDICIYKFNNYIEFKDITSWYCVTFQHYLKLKTSKYQLF